MHFVPQKQVFRSSAGPCKRDGENMNGEWLKNYIDKLTEIVHSYQCDNRYANQITIIVGLVGDLPRLVCSGYHTQRGRLHFQSQGWSI